MGVLSAIVENIPIIYAVLQMNPTMDYGPGLLITPTTGVGGRLLPVAWAIALEYAISVRLHLLIDARHFT